MSHYACLQPPHAALHLRQLHPYKRITPTLSWPCRYRALNVQAGTQFCDSAFQAEVSKVCPFHLREWQALAVCCTATSF